MSSAIVSSFLSINNIENKLLNAHHFMKNKSSSEYIDHDNLGIKGEFYCDSDVLHKLIGNNNVCVTQGFISMTSDNKFCVLTRSGSNTTGALIASVVDAEKLEIFTDTNGLYTTDPRKVKEAKLIPYVSYSVAQEAAACGAKILHPLSILPCEKKHIPIFIKNTFDPNGQSTIINGKNNDQNYNNVHLLTCQENVSIFQITSLDMWETSGVMYEIFGVFAEQKIDVNIITTSQFSISVTTNEKSQKKMDRVVNKLCEKYDVNLIKNCAIVTIIADKISHNKSVQLCHQLINEISSEPIHITDFGSNNLTVSYVINMLYADTLLNILHKELIEKI
jgi:aspartate kinase